MIHAYIEKATLKEAADLAGNGVVGLLEWCMTKSGMEKHGGPIRFDHVWHDKKDSVLVISSHEQYSPEEILQEVMLDTDPRAALLITQNQKISA
jgi:hypothetical protein